MFDRCRRCLGMGYKGGNVRGRWKVQTCRRCRGSGQDPRPETLPENQEARVRKGQLITEDEARVAATYKRKP